MCGLEDSAVTVAPYFKLNDPAKFRDDADRPNLIYLPYFGHS